MTTRFVLFLMSCLTVAASAAGTCRQAYSTVEITVSMKFTEPAHRVEWIYKTLSPRLEVSSGNQPYGARTATVDQSLQSVFCVPVRELEDVKSVFFLYGTRRVKLAARPVKWDSAGASVRRGIWPAIELDREKSPDWVIVEKAEWVVGADRKPRVDVYVHNLAAEEHPGFDLTLTFSNVRGLCYSPSPQAVIVPVMIGFVKGVPKVSSADVAFPSDPLQRDAKFEWGHCGNVLFKTGMGPTGPLAGRSAAVIRYLFADPLPATAAAIPKEGEKALTTAHIYALTERSIQVGGERVYPRITWVRNRSAL